MQKLTTKHRFSKQVHVFKFWTPLGEHPRHGILVFQKKYIFKNFDPLGEHPRHGILIFLKKCGEKTKQIHKIWHKQGPYGSSRAHIKSERSYTLQDCFYQGPGPPKPNKKLKFLILGGIPKVALSIFPIYLLYTP